MTGFALALVIFAGFLAGFGLHGLNQAIETYQETIAELRHRRTVHVLIAPSPDPEADAAFLRSIEEDL